MKTRFIMLILAGVVLASVVMIFRPVPVPAESECLVVNGTVVNIVESGSHDVVFRLKGRDESFYVNRGLERGLSLKSLREALIAQEITIKYPDHWTPLDPSGKIRHISKIEHNGAVVFSELN